MGRLLQDFKFAWRMLAKSPSFTLAAILCLALGIGATTAIFSVVNAVVLRPLPYAQAEKLVRVYSEFPKFAKGGLRRFWISAPEMLQLRRESRSFERVEAYLLQGVNVGGGNEPVRVTAAYMTGGTLPMLGVAARSGRLMDEHDDQPGSPLTAVISEGLSKRAFGGVDSILGKEILLDGRKSTVIGVMPASFRYPPGEVDPPEVWLPLQIDPARPGSKSSHYLSAVAKLKPGFTLAQARDEMTRLVTASGKGASPKNHSFSPDFHPVVMFGLQDEVVGNVRIAMLTLLGAVGFVLLIACVNVANLLLARAESRQREIAVRTAVGAGRGRLLRQFITEGVLLSLTGACVGLMLAWTGIRLIVTAGSTSIPRASEITIDPFVLVFTLVISVLTGILFGMAPLFSMGGKLAESLKAASGRNTASGASLQFRRFLVAGELALSLVLLIGAGLMIRAFWNLQEVNLNFEPKGLLTMRVALPRASYPNSQAGLEFWRRVQKELERTPGTSSATMISGLPPIRTLNANDTAIEGFVPTPEAPIQNVDYWQTAGKNYFETMRIPLIEGRYFDSRDAADAPPTVIINQTMARRFWGNQSALGRRVQPGMVGPFRAIVGIVADVKNAGIDAPTGTELYFPVEQQGVNGSGMTNPYIVVRSDKTNPIELAGPIRAAIRSVDPSLPAANVLTMPDVLAAARSRPRFITILLGLFSSVALVLAAIGIYGVISFSVAQRTGEFGLRMAMGATTANVLGIVVAEGLKLGVVGVLAGAAGALALTRVMKGLLFGVSAFDLPTFLSMAAVLSAVTFAACLIPALRATRVDPLVALRYE